MREQLGLQEPLALKDHKVFRVPRGLQAHKVLLVQLGI